MRGHAIGLIVLAACGARTDLGAPPSDRAFIDAGRTAVVARIGLGLEHACVVRADGAVFCWGTNRAGELGDGTMTDHALPTLVPGIDAVGITTSQAADAGPGADRGSNTCAWRTDGTVWCWGPNLDASPYKGSPHATPIPIAGWTSIAQVAAGVFHACARTFDGTVSCRGDIAFMPTQPVLQPRVQSTDATSIAVGSDYTCAAYHDGRARCWGLDVNGAIGNGRPVRDETMQPLEFIGSPSDVVGLSDVLQVSARTGHTCALLGSGGIACWGWNKFGQLGDGTTTASSKPVRVIGVDDAIAVTAGGASSCAIHRTGKLSCWGFLAGMTPTDVPLSDVVEVVAGDTATCARRTDDSIWCWGSIDGTNLGDGSTMNGAKPVRVAIP